MSLRPLTLLLPTLALLAGCSLAPPAGIRAVDGFDLERYLGTWYEIARLDHSFERGLIRVSAHYSRRADGGIEVLNRGYNPAQGRWKEARGRAYPLETADRGSLKVSFFGPFYGGYHVIALDRQEYRYALVSGSSRNYLWILARTPTLEPVVLQRLVAQAEALGFAVDELLLVEQSPAPGPGDP